MSGGVKVAIGILVAIVGILIVLIVLGALGKLGGGASIAAGSTNSKTGNVVFVGDTFSKNLSASPGVQQLAGKGVQPQALGGQGIQTPRAAAMSPQSAPGGTVSGGLAYVPSGAGYAALGAANKAAAAVQNKSQQLAAAAHSGQKVAEFFSGFKTDVNEFKNEISKVATGLGDAEAAAANNLMKGSLAVMTGTLPSVLATADGPSLRHALKTTASAASVVGAFHDGTLADIDPEGQSQLDKALSMTGVPATFGMDAVTAENRKNAEIMKTLLLNGQVDPCIEDIMQASAPFLATSEMLRRSVAAEDSLDRGLIIQTPMRFLYSSPLYRMAVPMPVQNPLGAQENVPPGLEIYRMSLQCGQQDKPMTMEPY